MTLPIHLLLTEEELALILIGIRAKSLPGFEPDWTPDDGADLLRRFDTRGENRLEDAARSLVARGLLLPPGHPDGAPNACAIPAAIYGLIGACAFADVSLHLQVQTPQRAQEIYLHGLGNVAVARTTPSERIVEFSYLGPKSRLVDAVEKFFYISEQQTLPAFKGKGLPISIENFQALRWFLDRQQRKDAEALLSRLKCPKEATKQLCDALEKALVTGTITIGRYSQMPANGSQWRNAYQNGDREPNYMRSFAIMVAPPTQTIFVLDDVEKSPQRDGPQLILRSLGADEVSQLISEEAMRN